MRMLLMPSPKQKRTMNRDTVSALTERIETAHQTTNELMRVQFESINEKVDTVIQAMESVKRDLKEDDKAIRLEVAANRNKADDRHTEIIKKIYWGAGVLAALEVLVQFLWKK